MIADYLKTNKSSDELVSIVVGGMDIDRGSNYLDYVASVSKGDIPSIWKQIRENKEADNNESKNGLKFFFALLTIAVMKGLYQ